MAVVKQVDFARTQRDGRINVRFSAVDDVSGSRTGVFLRLPPGSDVTARLQAWDAETQLLEEEEERVEREAVDEAFTIADIRFGSLPPQRARRRIARWFYKSRVRDFPAPMLKIATWLDGFTVNQIRNALGVSAAQANALKEKATRISTQIGPLFSEDDGNRGRL